MVRPVPQCNKKATQLCCPAMGRKSKRKKGNDGGEVSEGEDPAMSDDAGDDDVDKYKPYKTENYIRQYPEDGGEFEYIVIYESADDKTPIEPSENRHNLRPRENIKPPARYQDYHAGAGIAQTTGWPGTVAVVGKWFGGKKGLIFGIWNSHTSLGNILGTLLAAEYVENDWSLSFVYPALVMGVAAVLVFLFLVPTPIHVGLQDQQTSHSRQSRRSETEDDQSQVIVGDQIDIEWSANLRPNRHSANSSPHEQEEVSETTSLISRRGSSSASAPSAVTLSRALKIPGVVEFSLSLFFAKLVSYTFLFWLPTYIKSSTNLTPKQSSEVSTVFDVGGIVGAIAAGLLADCTACPALVCVAFYALAAPMLLAYQMYGALSYAINLTMLIVTGALVNGPYALITTAVSAELGK
ncbi:major facilitator superfamily domain-containing protein [Phthorimaea operculella]|nr:major facilitator superfamily domain-containing protein [Phthorimaea operculella]